MKNIYILTLLLVTTIAQAQISTRGTADGSITITPKGLQGSSNSTTGGGNLAVGPDALKSTIYNSVTASVANGSSNTAVGNSSLFANSSGAQNTAIGAFALQNNTTGVTNTAVGSSSLNSNIDGTHNTGVGNLALYYNLSGVRNTALGTAALFENRTGNFNTSIGNLALRFNETASYITAVGNRALMNSVGQKNTAIGSNALENTSTGAFNTAVGNEAGLIIKGGSNNTFLGFDADATVENFNNSMALGYNTKVNASNKVRIGDANVTVIEGQVAWSNPSDRRLKENIVYTNLIGLDFVNNLQTVSYSYIADKNKTRYDGFIAQDIEKLMVDLGIPFSGLKKSEDGMLSLAYSDFVMPLVNAIQEQQKQIETLKKQVQETADLKNRSGAAGGEVVELKYFEKRMISMKKILLLIGFNLFIGFTLKAQTTMVNDSNNNAAGGAAKVGAVTIPAEGNYGINAQEPCGTMEVLKQQLKNDPGMQKRMDERDKQINMYTSNPQLLNDDLVIIPVVVHVIYHTAAENISDAQIESQIAVLNEDFARQNADTVNTPAVFKGRAANINLKFVLAIRDPNGEATNGITRTYTDKTTFTYGTEMKNWPNGPSGGHDAWPAIDYLNVWVCNLDGMGLRGFATFPDALDIVDGIVVEPDAFGRGSEFNLAPKYDLGRTGTHEVGHWLRLSHTWGDGGCNIDDGIGDTPSAGAPNWIDSPCTFPGPNSCSRIEPDGIDHPDMFQNYMDYSRDQCMNLFTKAKI
jgi:hypothetical protein